MTRTPPGDTGRTIVIGAGMGGLAAAIRLAAAGLPVTLAERFAEPGGKMRTRPSAAGPVDAGPTVLTMRNVFDALFAAAGEALDDRLRLLPQRLLARHWWDGGATLDLFADAGESAAAVRAFGGPGAEHDFRRFSARAAALHAAFEGPVIRAPAVSPLAVAGAAALRPALWPDLAPGATLAARLARGFRDPRLAQLFGRYATYVGGSPFRSPAVLGLIWHTEASGVWAVEGGMHALARALDALARRLGVETLYGVAAERILADGEGVTGVALSDGSTRRAAHVVHAGDPAALADGLLGPAAQGAVPRSATEPRSHSAWVWSFAARPSGVPLALHNVFFSDDPAREFGPIAAGRMPERPTLYVCAEDRAEGATPPSPGAPERFEIIMNAPHAAHTAAEAAPQEFETCRRLTFETLGRMGLTFDRLPGPEGLTGPAQFARMFPGSQGAIYGPSPHGTMAAFRRPTARTRLPGLWIAGGGAHPGAGVPMAALSGMHAADAILACRPSTVRSARTDTPGGTSMASPTTGPAPSR